MGKMDPGIDAYIAKSADFAKPILKYVRKIVHEACPIVEEAIKWGVPNFIYKGIMCNMAAFKEHCAFGFCKGKFIFGDKRVNAGEEAMGSFGRITRISDLPSEKVLKDYIKKAMKLNEEGGKAPAAQKARGKIEFTVLSYFMDAIKKNRKALEALENFSATNKKEYIMWIVEAKTEETRKKRLKTAIGWMSEGKIRNWKYLKR